MNNNLQVFMKQKKIAIANSIAIDFTDDCHKQLKDFFDLSNNSYVLGREVIYLSEKADITINISQQIEIYILFKDFVYLDDDILSSKIVRRFVKKYPILASSYELISPMKLDFKNLNIVWDSLSFIYDAKQAALTLLITASI